MTGKQKNAPVRSVNTFSSKPLEEIYLDILGIFSPTMNFEMYYIHFLDSFTEKLDLKLINNRTEFLSSRRDYKLFAETYFASQGQRVKKIRLDNSR